jgi:hypothetical protein
MAKQRKQHRARKGMQKTLTSVLTKMHDLSPSVQTYLFAYQQSNGAMKVVASPNMYRFVQLTDGLMQVFHDANLAKDEALSGKYQSTADAIVLLSKKDMKNLATELGHNARLSKFRQKFGTSESTKQVSENQSDDEDAEGDITGDSAGGDKEQADDDCLDNRQRSAQAYEDKFQRITEAERIKILTTPTSRLDKFKLYVAILTALEIHDPGILLCMGGYMMSNWSTPQSFEDLRDNVRDMWCSHITNLMQSCNTGHFKNTRATSKWVSNIKCKAHPHLLQF